MLLYLHDGSYMFRQNNVILREQLGSFLSYFNVNTVGGKSWNVWYRPMLPACYAANCDGTLPSAHGELGSYRNPM
jgi:hypothetical protein